MKKYTVPSQVLDQTHRCMHNFSCLETGEYQGPDGCEVDYLYGENILFLKSKKTAHACPYRAHFSDRQMCLCPTKYNVVMQEQDTDAMSPQCGSCEEAWRNYYDFLSDQYITLTGYQVSFKNLKAGKFIFNHSCGTTVEVPAGFFVHLYDGPIFEGRATGSERCPEYCLRGEELQACPVECECAYIREVLQIVKKWPKVRRSLPQI